MSEIVGHNNEQQAVVLDTMEAGISHDEGIEGNSS
jgi:hypothetical protein